MAPFGTIATTLAAFSYPNSISPYNVPQTNFYNPLSRNSVAIFSPGHRFHHRTYYIAKKQRTKPKTALHSTISAASSFHPEAVIYMILLALQFGTQPVLTKKFTPKTVNRSTVVMAQEVSKFLLSFAMLLLSGNFAAAISGWNVYTWLMIAGVPAALYCVQNIATLMAYQNLDPLTFNVLNQTKTLSAALCCYLIIGRKQSRVQAASLVILFAAALIIEKVVSIDKLFFWKKTEPAKSIEKETTEQKATKSSTHFTQGVIPVLLASFISGLAGALVQKNLQSASGCGKTGGRDSYLFTMELCVASMIFFLASLLTNQDGKRIREKGFFDEWTPQTMIPVVTNAVGGIVVGLVTKYAGAVKKGFALIFGLLLSGILQAVLGREEGDDSPKITKEQIVGGVLAALSLWMHSAYPYSPKPALLAK